MLKNNLEYNKKIKHFIKNIKKTNKSIYIYIYIYSKLV